MADNGVVLPDDVVAVPSVPRKPRMPAMKGSSMAKGMMKGGKGVTKQGFKGGGKESGFVNTPMWSVVSGRVGSNM